jgi:hypothetical protein
LVQFKGMKGWLAYLPGNSVHVQAEHGVEIMDGSR